MTDYDAAIIGAGPAGISASMELASRGWKVLLLDKSSFPRDKVCGGFIGPENKALLERYNILQPMIRRGAKKVTHIYLSAENGQSVRVPLYYNGRADFGLGFSRKHLDELMLERAKRLGVVFEDAALAQDIMHSPDHCMFKIVKSKICQKEEITARHLICAHGATSKTAGQKPLSRLFGVFALFDSCREIGSDVIMHFIDQGHVGINRFENGAINVCYAVKEPLFKQCRGKYEKMWEHFLSSNPCLYRQMRSAKPIGRWKGTFIDLDKPKQFFDGNAFYVGDAAALIHPVAGGGISLALNSGIFLGNLLGSRRPGEVCLESVAAAYAKAFRCHFSWTIRLSKIIGSLGHNKHTANAFIRMLKWRDKNIHALFHAFHQPPALKT